MYCTYIKIIKRKSNPIKNEYENIKTIHLNKLNETKLMVMDLVKFTDRIKNYSKTNYGIEYYRFWERKINIEKEGNHILDSSNLEDTYKILMPIMREWKTYRPFDTNVISKRLMVKLEEISDSYNRIRAYDLLTFNEVPKKDARARLPKINLFFFKAFYIFID